MNVRYANYLIAAGAGGLLTGLGGRYFFLLPVYSTKVVAGDPTTEWGTAFFSFDAPGSITGTTWNVADWIRSALTIMFDLDAKTLIVPGHGINYWSNGDWTFSQTVGNIWFPGLLGEKSGWLFLALLAVGLYYKYK